MNLEEFVAESLVQIVNGVVKAQTKLSGTGALVNPIMTKLPRDGSILKAEGQTGKLVSDVQFDVAVTATEGQGTKGGIGIMVGMIGLGSQGESKSVSGFESRIKFKVPVVLPVHKKS